MAYKPCKYLDLGAGETARKGMAYRCLVEVPKPQMPNSVTLHYNYHWPPRKNFVTKADCEGCPFREDA